MQKKSWGEFRETGLFWLVNQTLHLFGWALVVEIIDDEITNVYPARVGYRGFSEEINTDGYIKVSKYMNDNAEQLLKESME